MSEAHEQLLEATIQHLRELKEQGVKHVAVSPQVLADLCQSRVAAKKSPGPTPSPIPLAPGTAPATPAARPSQPPPFRPSSPPPTRGPSIPPPTPMTSNPPLSPATPAASNRLAPEELAAAIAELREVVLSCRKCARLAAARKNVVFGVGDIQARLMFVGEAPGADEDQQGEPFVGKAGQLLTKIIQAMGLTRSTVFIANILKCRPDTPGQSAGNRKPTLEEMKACLPYLERQIDLIKPEVIVALGATAVEGLLGKPMPITRLRGQWQSYRSVPLMPTYHPAYLLRNQALSERRKVWEDMLLVMERLGLPISEKQRNYFL